MNSARRLVLLLPVALALSGCGRLAPAPGARPAMTSAPRASPVIPTPVDTPRPPEPVTLVIWHAPGNPAGINVLNDHARRAVAGMPGFKVNVVAVAPGDMLDQYRNAVAGGGGLTLEEIAACGRGV